MKTNKSRLSSDKIEVLLVRLNSILGSGILPILDGVVIPLKARICILEFSWSQFCFWMSRSLSWYAIYIPFWDRKYLPLTSMTWLL